MQSVHITSFSWWGGHNATIFDKVCQWLAACQWFSPGTIVESGVKHHT